MLRVLSILLLTIAICSDSIAGEGTVTFHGVRSQAPAQRWEEAFVTGNGRLGAMLFGNPTSETLVLNHCRLFLPLGNREIVPDLAPYVPELRRVMKLISPTCTSLMPRERLRSPKARAGITPITAAP